MNVLKQGILASIVQFSLRFKGIIVALACISIVYGIYTLSQVKYDVFPEFAPPQVVIQTEAPGLAPEQVEVLVTRPIENAVNGVSAIESLRSGSIQGLSIITAIFSPGSDIYRARQAVAERIATLGKQLPPGVNPPLMTPLTSSTSIVMSIGLTSKMRSLMELRTIADFVVLRRLLAVPGVAKVAVFGGEVKQIQIQVNPSLLIRYNVSLDDVLYAARQATGVEGAGFIDTNNQRIILNTAGQSLTPDKIGKTVVVSHNDPNGALGIMLKDVANVAEAPEPPIGAAGVMGNPGVMLMVSAQYGTNTLEVTRRIEDVLKELSPVLETEAIELHSDIFRPANLIETSTHNVKTSLLIGAVLVIIVLSLFLFNFRTAAISCTAIPLSLLAAITVLNKLGISLNTMTLGGLAIAIGEVVDDAVIDVENVLRRLRENRRMDKPRPPLQVVFDASIEVRSAVVYATLAVVLVFIPILTMSGVAGRLFGPLGVAYIAAVFASLIVALTVTPALCLILLGPGDIEEKEPPIVQWLKGKYRSLLVKVEQHPKTVMSGVGLIVVIGIAMFPFFGGGFIPELREGHFIIHMTTVPGTSLQESMRLGRQVTLELLKNPDVRSVALRMGRAEVADDIMGTHSGEFEVDLKPLKGEEEERVMAQIRNNLSQFVGANFSINTFLTERVDETLAGYTAAVVVNVFGNDLDTLDAKAREIADVLNKIQGATGVQIQSPPGTPQLIVKLREKDAQHWGFNPVQVLSAIKTAYQGDIVGQIYDGDRVFNVTVILDPDDRKSITDVGNLPLRNVVGTYIRLKQLADIQESSGRYVVLHDGARRVQAITCNVAGRDVGSFVAKVKKQILSSISFPAGTYIEFAGTAAAESRSRRDLLIHSLLVGIGILLLLSMVMANYRNLILVLANLPFALVGGVFTVFVSGGWLSIGSLVGFVTLFGITLRNSIMMISHYEHLVSFENAKWGFETAIRGALERLAPILMTAVVTGLGLLPLAIGSGAAGREIEGPMALVILGGLVTSTALNLLVLPTLALRYGRFGDRNDYA